MWASRLLASATTWRPSLCRTTTSPALTAIAVTVGASVTPLGEFSFVIAQLGIAAGVALAAALLLNAGRYPYSSAVEGVALPGAPTLKELSRRWIEHTEVAKVLRSDWDLEPHNVFRLVSRGDDPPRGLTPTEHLLRDILFGSMNVDALDRLVRDGRGARVSFGMVEALPLIEHLRIVGQENRAVLTLDEEGAGLLQSLVFSRYLIHFNVYGHHALRIPTVMFTRAVQDAVEKGTATLDKLSAHIAGCDVVVRSGA